MNSGLIFHPMMTHSPQDILSMMDFVDSWFDLDAENDLHDWVLAYVLPMVMFFEFHFHRKLNRFPHLLLGLDYLLVLTIPFPSPTVPIVFGILHA